MTELQPGMTDPQTPKATAPATDPQRRAALVRAMVELCDERGFGEVTVALLARRAGLQPAHFDAEFESLEECFLAVWDLAFDEVGEKLLEAYTSAEDWQARMRTAAGLLLRLLRKRSQPVARVLVLNSDAAGRRAILRREQFLRSFSAMIDAGRFESPLARGVPEGTALALAASIHHAVFSRLAGGRESELKPLLPDLMCMVVTPYLGTRAGLAELSSRS